MIQRPEPLDFPKLATPDPVPCSGPDSSDIIARFSSRLDRLDPGGELLIIGDPTGQLCDLALGHPSRPRVATYHHQAPPHGAAGPIPQFHDLNRLAAYLGQRLVYSPEPAGFFAYIHPHYRINHPQETLAAESFLEQMLHRIHSDLTTRRHLISNWLGNLKANIASIMGYPDLTQLASALPGIPALVVGAGPSLDQSLPQLPGVSGKALILAAASAMGPLHRVGVTPQLIVALEGKDESRQFAGLPHDQTLMAAASTGHPAHFGQWNGPKGVFHLYPWVAEIFGQGVPLPSGGHATSAAFSLALLMGCNPIILVGQDLAFSGGRQHASGRPGGEDETLTDTTEVAAIGGGTLKTSPIMASYINWYQESAAYLRDQRPEIRIINCTQQGAHLLGFEHHDLKDILSSLVVKRPGIPSIIQAVSDLDLPSPTQAAMAAGREMEVIDNFTEKETLDSAIELPQGSLAREISSLVGREVGHRLWSEVRGVIASIRDAAHA